MSPKMTYLTTEGASRNLLGLVANEINEIHLIDKVQYARWTSSMGSICFCLHLLERLELVAEPYRTLKIHRQLLRASYSRSRQNSLLVPSLPSSIDFYSDSVQPILLTKQPHVPTAVSFHSLIHGIGRSLKRHSRCFQPGILGSHFRLALGHYWHRTISGSLLFLFG